MDQHEHCACYERVLTWRQTLIDWAPVIVTAIDVLRSFWS
jgi:hypothetical protein